MSHKPVRVGSESANLPTWYIRTFHLPNGEVKAKDAIAKRLYAYNFLG